MGEHIIHFEISSNQNDYLDLPDIKLKLNLNIMDTGSEKPPTKKPRIKTNNINPFFSFYHETDYYLKSELIDKPPLDYSEIDKIVESYLTINQVHSKN